MVLWYPDYSAPIETCAQSDACLEIPMNKKPTSLYKNELRIALPRTNSNKKNLEKCFKKPLGKKHEKYWCTACQLWVYDGKAKMTKHLRTVHPDGECDVVMITNAGMLKVTKEQFLPLKKYTGPFLRENTFKVEPDYENYDGVEIFDHRRVDPMNYNDSRTGTQQKLNSNDKENVASFKKNGTILPNGWKRKLKQGAKRYKEIFNYVSPSGDLFTSRKEMTRYLNKPVSIKSNDKVVWGFESFKHDLCDNLIVNLGESHDDEEDVYFTLKCQENIKTKSEDVIEEWCEEYAACDKGRGNKVNTLLAENAGDGRGSKLKNFRKQQQKIHVEERGNQLLDEMKKDQLNIAKILKLSRKNIKKRITEKSQTYSRRIKLVRMKRITCSRCHRSFDKKSEMLEHVSKCHIWSTLLATVTHKPPFICPLSECSFLQRNRYNVAQHIARGSDPIHQDFIMKIANSKYPNCFWNNEWRIENSVHHNEESESLDDEGFDSGGEAKSELEIDIKMKKLKILSQMKTAYARKVMHLQNLKTCQILDFEN